MEIPEVQQTELKNLLKTMGSSPSTQTSASPPPDVPDESPGRSRAASALAWFHLLAAVKLLHRASPSSFTFRGVGRGDGSVPLPLAAMATRVDRDAEAMVEVGAENCTDAVGSSVGTAGLW